MPLAVPDGLLRVQFIPTVASATLAPTVAEFTAGTDISKGISAAPEGFTAETTFVEAPNLLTVVTPKVAGRLNIPDSALNMYWADATAIVRRSHHEQQALQVPAQDARRDADDAGRPE
jgi:hypothetical protein